MESRIHGDMYVRFGGRLVETYHRKVEKRCWPSLLKEIAAVCGINKVLTTHVARHTFACMAVEYGMPIDVLAKILGHSNTNMTRHYAKFSETVIGREMEMFGQKLTSAAAE